MGGGRGGLPYLKMIMSNLINPERSIASPSPPFLRLPGLCPGLCTPPGPAPRLSTARLGPRLGEDQGMGAEPRPHLRTQRRLPRPPASLAPLRALPRSPACFSPFLSFLFFFPSFSFSLYSILSKTSRAHASLRSWHRLYPPSHPSPVRRGPSPALPTESSEQAVHAAESPGVPLTQRSPLFPYFFFSLP